jgi:hypothetical protein
MGSELFARNSHCGPERVACPVETRPISLLCGNNSLGSAGCASELRPARTPARCKSGVRRPGAAPAAGAGPSAHPEPRPPPGHAPAAAVPRRGAPSSARSRLTPRRAPRRDPRAPCALPAPRSPSQTRSACSAASSWCRCELEHKARDELVARLNGRLVVVAGKMPLRLIFVSTKAGGIGIEFTGATRALLLEPWVRPRTCRPWVGCGGSAPSSRSPTTASSRPVSQRDPLRRAGAEARADGGRLWGRPPGGVRVRRGYGQAGRERRAAPGLPAHRPGECAVEGVQGDSGVVDPLLREMLLDLVASGEIESVFATPVLGPAVPRPSP